MERYNPFASAADSFSEKHETSSSERSKASNIFDKPADMSESSGLPRRPHQLSGFASNRTRSEIGASQEDADETSKYSVSFPDPFEGQEVSGTVKQTNRLNGVHFATGSQSVDDINNPTPSSPYIPARQRQSPGGGISSFLSRATSVTSSSVGDRVSGAVGSVKSAVDSLSTQLQAVPNNLNERLSSTADQLQQQQQSTASYLASKLSSATGQNSTLPPLQITRQRVILILDSFSNTDWPNQFNQYRRMLSGQSATQSAFTSFLSSATAQLGAGSLSGSQTDMADLIEQADYRDVSVLANQSSLSATVFIAASSKQSSSSSKSVQALPARIVRPEFVVVKQQSSREKLAHLRSILTALNYCLVPMFEPIEIWNIFQDRQLIFASMLRVQTQLGKENFPLIPQVFCQTQQDLINYISSSSILLPCLVRMGDGRIRIDKLQGLRDFASIMATSDQSCTVEQFLEVKYDLVIQKIGTSLKLFKRYISQEKKAMNMDPPSSTRQSSIGKLTSLISSSSSGQSSSQQVQQASMPPMSSSQLDVRRDSGSQVGSTSSFERSSEVCSRYRGWMDAIAREFEGKLEMFALKVCIADNDREYIMGLDHCTRDFMGSHENRDEDRRSFVELVTSKVNTLSPKSQLGRNLSLDPSNSEATNTRRTNSFEKSPTCPATPNSKQPDYDSPLSWNSTGDKKRFSSTTHINGGPTGSPMQSRPYGQLATRSQSVSTNQADYCQPREQVPAPPTKGNYLDRRSSDRTYSSNLGSCDDISSYGSTIDGQYLPSSLATGSINMNSGIHQRQSSLGQSFFDQTSTALSSFQKQSLSFFKRLDSRSGFEFGSNTPPQSAKSDKAFDRSFVTGSLGIVSGGTPSQSSKDSSLVPESQGRVREGFKSQSIDGTNIVKAIDRQSGVEPPKPPKPPPPPLMMSNRQSSLATYSHSRPGSTTTPSSTPTQTRQNSAVSSAGPNQSDIANGSGSRQRVLRQNSALSAFERLNADYSSQPLTSSNNSKTNYETSDSNSPANRPDKPFTSDSLRHTATELVKKTTNFDSASITSGDSNSTGETNTAEDTMNNLKRTFASIFGDKCE